MYTILIIEDDKTIGQTAQRCLNSDNQVYWARTRNEAAAVLDSNNVDIVILDLEMPSGSGPDVISMIKQRKLDIGVLIMTVNGDVDHRVRGVHMDIHNYLIKPISVDDLVARIAAVKQHHNDSELHTIEIGEIQLDTIGNRVIKNGAAVHLSKRELNILSILMQGADRYFSKAMLEERLYNLGESTSGNAIEVHISSIRKKLGKSLIKTARGLGYTIETSYRS